MREAIFRTWIDGEMHAVDNLEFTDGVLTHIEAYPLDVWHADVTLKLGVVVLEQYSGFKDESDKLIYEGDIVHVWDNGNGVVMFKNGSFMADLGSNDSSSLSSEAWPLLTWNPEDYEVIGNIHENPELLEMEK